jgi:F0F1-type ATP synthase membrane subunit b/b'
MHEKVDEEAAEKWNAIADDLAGQTVTPEELQDIIDQSGIKEMVNTITEDFKEEAKTIVDDLKQDWDVTLEDGLEDEEWDEDHALDQVMNDMVADLDEPSVEEPMVKEVEGNLSIDLADFSNPGLIERKIEKRKVKRVERNPNNPKRFKKGPLWDYRTNRNNDDLIDD